MDRARSAAEGELTSDDESGGGSESDDGGPTLDSVSRKLHEKLLGTAGRLRRDLASSLSCSDITVSVCPRAHRFAITCLALSSAEDFCYTGSKDCTIVRWDTETGKRVSSFPGKRLKPGEEAEFDGHTAEVLALALTSDGRYLASGGRDRLIRIWDCRSNKLIDSFQGHRDIVSGLAFRKGSHTLYSASHDRSVRAWNIDEMAFIEALFGHQSDITAIDCHFRERAVTCSSDRSVRFWKIPEESQLVLQGGHKASLDCVKMLDEVHFLSGSQDGTLALWHTSKKKPCSIIRGAHGDSWISSVATLPNSNVVASGASDGKVRFWKADLNTRRLTAPSLGSVDVPGFCNALAFGSTGRILVAGGGQEHRLGRWQRDPNGKNRLYVFRLPEGPQAEESYDSAGSQSD